METSLKTPESLKETTVKFQDAPLAPQEVPTSSPAASQEQPVTLQEAPVKLQEAPLVLIEAPVVLTEAPVVLTEAPVVLTEAAAAAVKKEEPQPVALQFRKLEEGRFRVKVERRMSRPRVPCVRPIPEESDTEQVMMEYQDQHGQVLRVDIDTIFVGSIQ